MRDLTIVVPTYNERDQIETLVDRILHACAAHAIAAEVIVVDDNSPDGTGDHAEMMSRTRAVRVIHRSGKLGLGSAVLEGFAASDSGVVGVIDGDLSHPPELIPTLYGVLRERGAGAVVASRYITGGGTEAWSHGRALLSRAGCAVARPITPVRDAMSGFFLIRREQTLGVRTSVSGFKIGLELLVKSGLESVVEVGYTFVGRNAGGSKMTIGEAMRFARQLVALYFFRLNATAPQPRYETATESALSYTARTRAATNVQSY